jgi:hypothetical protein
MAEHPTPPSENPASGGDGLAALLDGNARLRAEVEQLRIENQLLRERINIIIKQLYDKKSEALDPAQLQLLLDPDSAKKYPPPIPQTPDRRLNRLPPKSVRRANPATSPTSKSARRLSSTMRSKRILTASAKSSASPPTVTTISPPSFSSAA